MLLTACPAPAPQVVEKVVTQIVEQKVDVIQTVEVEKKVVETQVVEKIVEATQPRKPSRSSPGSSTTRATCDPKSDERVGNEYLRNTIPALRQGV